MRIIAIPASAAGCLRHRDTRSCCILLARSAVALKAVVARAFRMQHQRKFWELLV